MKDATTQQFQRRENEQEIISYIAALMDGEGHISIGKNKLSKNYRYRFQLYFSNTDTRLVDYFTDFCTNNDIHFYIRKRIKQKKSYLDQYEVSVVGIEHAKHFLDLIYPKLIGNKKEYAGIVLKFLESRINRKINFKAERNEKGQYLHGHSPEYTGYEEQLYTQYKELRDPQRLHAMPLPSSLRKG